MNQNRDDGRQNGPSEEEIKERKRKIKNKCASLLSEDARSRINNLRTVKPDLVTKVETKIIQLDEADKLDAPVSDDALKDLLKRIQESGDDMDVKFR